MQRPPLPDEWKKDGDWDDPHIQELLKHLARTSLKFKLEYQIAQEEESWRPEVVQQALAIAREASTRYR